MTVACYLQLSHPLDTTLGEKVGYFLGVCTAIMTFLIYPLMMLGVMFSTKETLLMPEIKMRFGAIYNGKKIDTFA